MSLNDLDREDDELDAISPKSKKRKIGKSLGKARIWLILIVVGIVLGILVGHYFVEPLLQTEDTGICKSCIATKDLLSQENDCLYSLVDNPQEAINQCTIQNT